MMVRGRAVAALIGALLLVGGAGGCGALRRSGVGGPGTPAAGIVGSRSLPVWARTFARSCVVPGIGARRCGPPAASCGSRAAV